MITLEQVDEILMMEWELLSTPIKNGALPAKIDQTVKPIRKEGGL